MEKSKIKFKFFFGNLLAIYLEEKYHQMETFLLAFVLLFTSTFAKGLKWIELIIINIFIIIKVVEINSISVRTDDPLYPVLICYSPVNSTHVTLNIGVTSLSTSEISQPAINQFSPNQPNVVIIIFEAYLNQVE